MTEQSLALRTAKAADASDSLDRYVGGINRYPLLTRAEELVLANAHAQPKLQCTWSVCALGPE